MAKQKKNDSQQSAGPLGHADTSRLEAFIPGLETIIATAAAKVFAEKVGKGAETPTTAAIDYLRREGPVAHTVVASWFDKECYCAALEFHNLTLHGAYVEKIWVTEPTRDIGLEVPDVTGKSDWVKPAGYFPIYLPAQQTKQILVRLKEELAGTLSAVKVAGISYGFTISGGADVDTASTKNVKVARVRLRRAGPVFRRPGIHSGSGFGL